MVPIASNGEHLGSLVHPEFEALQLSVKQRCASACWRPMGQPSRNVAQRHSRGCAGVTERPRNGAAERVRKHRQLSSAPDTAGLRDPHRCSSTWTHNLGSETGARGEHHVPHAIGRAASRSEIPPATAPMKADCTERVATRGGGAAMRHRTRHDPSASPRAPALLGAPAPPPAKRRTYAQKPTERHAEPVEARRHYPPPSTNSG